MRPKKRWAILATMLAAAITAPPTLDACPRKCPLVPRSIQAERDAARREADESRVAQWLAQRILEDVSDTDPVLDITADEVEAATGVDASTLDPERVRERVATMLRELAVGPSGPPLLVPGGPPAPGAPAAPARAVPPGAVTPASPRVHGGAGAAGHSPAEDDSACGHTTSLH